MRKKEKYTYLFLGVFNLLIVIYCAVTNSILCLGASQSIAYHLGQLGALLCFSYLGLHLVTKTKDKIKAWKQKKKS